MLETKKPAAERRSGLISLDGEKLFQFDVIASVNIGGGEGEQRGGRIGALVDYDAFAENFTWQIFPLIFLVGAAKTVHFVLITLGLGNRFGQGALVTEHPEIIAHAYALIGAEIYVH